MSRIIKRVAILGSGVMGSRIACHFANIGLEVLLLDIPTPNLPEADATKPAARNKLVNDALTAAVKGKPSPLYHASYAKRITTGNFDDDLSKIADCDWVLEAIVERLDIKQSLFERVEKFRKAGSLITSNTSGIPIHLMAAGRSEDFRKNFCGTHFFNPPRYLRLLEIIPTTETAPEVVDFLMHYGDVFLGKQTVLCKDTPAFIANRVGVYAMAKIFQLTQELGLTIEEADALTGAAIGRPNTGTFRLGDLVGMDTSQNVIKGLYGGCPNDEQREVFKAPAFLETMIANKWLGDKTKQGFYKKTDRKDENGKAVILSLDLNTLEYRPNQKPKLASLAAAKQIEDLGSRIRSFFKASDKGGELVRRSLLALFSYVANRIPEISDDLFRLDDALRAGFNWEKGPFETWDMVGVAKAAELLQAEGLSLPAWVSEFLAAGNKTFYRVENGTRQYYDLASKSYKAIPGGESFIILSDVKATAGRVVWENKDASLIYLGDGVLNVEFHTKMNSIGDGIIGAINKAIDLAEKGDYAGIVLSNEGVNFSAGANLALISMMAFEQEWDELEMAVRFFQNTSMRIRYSGIPVVAAPHSMVLGGGCELTMHSNAVVAAAETYIGLVEVGVGLIPGGGGTKEFVVRAADKYTQTGAISTAILQEYLMGIATAKVSTSAQEAFDLGIFVPTKDKIAINGVRRIKEAKDTVLAMLETGYTAAAPRTDIRVLGRGALGSFYAGISGLQFGNYASEHDAKIAKKVAYVMCGGDLSGETIVSEQYLLDLEREQFLSLLGEIKTLQRIEHMLKTGKPLRN